MRYALFALFCCSCCILGLTATGTPALADPPDYDEYDCYVIPDPEEDDVVQQWYAIEGQHHFLIDDHDAGSPGDDKIHQTYPVWKTDVFLFAVEEDSWDVGITYYGEEYANVRCRAIGDIHYDEEGDLVVYVRLRDPPPPPPPPLWDPVIDTTLDPDSGRWPFYYVTSADLEYDWTEDDWNGRKVRIDGRANKPGCGDLQVAELWFGLYDEDLH